MTDVDLRNGPVFIIGCPRSGTTLLLNLLAGTRAFGYVSTSGDRGDATESLHGRTRIYDAPLVGAGVYRHRGTLLGISARLGPLQGVATRQLPTAIEPWAFWEDLLPNFRPEWGDGPAVDPDPAALTDGHRNRARRVVGELLARQHRDVLLSKYTDFPRVDLMQAAFPDARFVHIRRDAFAVSASNAVEIESGRFGTWGYREWWSAAWPNAAREHWKATGETRLGFAAHNRNHLVTLIDRAAAATTAPTLTISYQNLVARPEATLAEILEFSGVDSRSDLRRLVGSRRVANSNDRWRQKRSPAEAALLDDILSPTAPWPSP
jgi:hypothetical protein